MTQHTNSVHAARRPMLHALLAGAALTVAMAGTMSAQARPPITPRGAGADTGVVRQPAGPGARGGRGGRMGPGMAPGTMPGMGPEMGQGRGRGMGPGAGPGGAAGPRGMGQRGNRGPGRGNGNAAAGLLRMRSQLELTDDQVKRLEALQTAQRPQRNQSDMMRAQADLMDATRGDGNINAARTALERMSRVRNEEVLAGIKARQDARNVLTAAQKTRLENFRMQADGRRGMRQGGREGARPMGRQMVPQRGAQLRGQPMRGPQMRGQQQRGAQLRGPMPSRFDRGPVRSELPPRRLDRR